MTVILYKIIHYDTQNLEMGSRHQKLRYSFSETFGVDFSFLDFAHASYPGKDNIVINDCFGNLRSQVHEHIQICYLIIFIFVNYNEKHYLYISGLM